jgi:hypothetical protein
MRHLASRLYGVGLDPSRVVPRKLAEKIRDDREPQGRNDDQQLGCNGQPQKDATGGRQVQHHAPAPANASISTKSERRVRRALTVMKLSNMMVP